MHVDPELLLVGFSIAFMSAYTALDLGQRDRLRKHGTEPIWLFSAALIMSSGFWSIHLVMLLATGYPFRTTFGMPQLGLSVLLAIPASGAAVWAIQRPSARGIAAGGAVMGISIVLMRYVHLVIRGPVQIFPFRFLVSSAIAASVSAVGLYLATEARNSRHLPPHLRKGAAALALSAAMIGAVFTELAGGGLGAAQGLLQLEPRLTARALTSVLEIGGVVVFLTLLLALIATRREVAHSEHRFQVLLQTSLDLVYVLDAQGTVRYVSPSVEDILRLPSEDVVGRNLSWLTHPDDIADAQRQFDLHKGAPGMPFHATTRLRHLDGTWRTFEGSGTNLLLDPDVAGIVVHLIDVTKQRTAQDELQRLSLQRELILNSAGEGIIGAGEDGRITFVNPVALAMIGRTEAETVGDYFCEVVRLLSPEGGLRPFGDCPVDVALSTGSTVRACNEFIVRDDRSQIAVDYTVTPKLKGERVVGAVALFVDMSLRRSLEEEKRQVVDRYLSMLEMIGDAVVIESNDGEVTYVNQAAREALGVSVGDRRDGPRSRVGRVRIMDWQGRDVPAEEQVVPAAALTGHIVSNVERTIIRPDGARRHFLLAAAPSYAANGATVGAIYTLRDVTERKDIEEELLRARRIESVGLLAGGIAHDFNNILTVVLGNLSLAKGEVAVGTDLETFLSTAERACQQAAKLTRQLLTFSKGGSPVTSALALGEIVEESVRFALSGSNVRPEIHLLEKASLVQADAVQLNQVISNLVINAAQAMPDGGVVMVTAEPVRVAAGDALPLPDGPYVRLSFQDSGVGIAKENLDRVFDPYFTTKPSGQGLGLATTWSVVRGHGGHISIESTLGLGTTVQVYLPAAQEPSVESHGRRYPSLGASR